MNVYKDSMGILNEFYEDFIEILKDVEWMLSGACKVSRRIPKGSLTRFLKRIL